VAFQITRKHARKSRARFGHKRLTQPLAATKLEQYGKHTSDTLRSRPAIAGRTVTTQRGLPVRAHYTATSGRIPPDRPTICPNSAHDIPYKIWHSGPPRRHAWPPPVRDCKQYLGLLVAAQQAIW